MALQRDTRGGRMLRRLAVDRIKKGAHQAEVAAAVTAAAGRWVNHLFLLAAVIDDANAVWPAIAEVAEQHRPRAVPAHRAAFALAVAVHGEGAGRAALEQQIQDLVVDHVVVTAIHAATIRTGGEFFPARGGVRRHV